MQLELRMLLAASDRRKMLELLELLQELLQELLLEWHQKQELWLLAVAQN